MDHERKHSAGASPDTPPETPEERAGRVADIKLRLAQGRYRVDSREILYNMLKTAP
jgi:anti-sigma28 factor (negative regulator of flagellin synthesis)